MPTPHKHAAIIKAWADGAEVQVSTNAGWYDLDSNPNWCDFNQYRIKPEPAAPKWPQTTMTSPELTNAYDANKMMICALEDVANAAIAHACEAGQLVPADKVREIEAKARAEGRKEGKGDTKERDIAVALLVRDSCEKIGTYNLTYDYLEDVIRRVPK